MAASQLGLADEMDYQKQERLREMIRDLENTVVNGGQPASNPEGGKKVDEGYNPAPLDERLPYRR
jgi:hypothetical protein